MLNSLQGSEEDLNRLVECYQGNPLALKITATSICDLFDCRVADFLKQKVAIFNGIRHLFKQQIDRLSVLEEQVMYWLAINRESVDVKEIQTDLVPSLPLGAILEVLESLRSRSLVEKTAEGFTQQPVVIEYMTEQFIARVCSELINSTQSILFLDRYALLKATSKDYIRDSQKRIIVEPIIKNAIASLGSKKALVTKLKQLLKQFCNGLSNDAEVFWHPSPPRQLDSNYAISNLLNLFNYLEVDLTGFDFSGFSISQAHLTDVKLQQVNFSGADFCKSVFAKKRQKDQEEYCRDEMYRVSSELLNSLTS
ncbi:MAG: pentapeptide repeat-containing protein [Hydrococcus sp. CRU_1_1]|nr:pentapeptide repeat-containing protein [Hydrococcus sp. CRU_1_1]